MEQSDAVVPILKGFFLNEVLVRREIDFDTDAAIVVLDLNSLFIIIRIVHTSTGSTSFFKFLFLLGQSRWKKSSLR